MCVAPNEFAFREDEQRKLLAGQSRDIFSTLIVISVD